MPFEDLVATGNLAAAEAAHRYDPERDAELATYAFPGIRGRMLDFAKDETFRLDAEVSRMTTAIAAPSQENATGTARWILLLMSQQPNAADELDEALQLARAMADLPPEERAVLHCLYVEGRTLGRTAEILGVAKRTVQRRDGRLRIKLLLAMSR